MAERAATLQPRPAPAPAGAAVVIAGLHHAYGSTTVLTGIDLQIPAGAHVAVMGRVDLGAAGLVVSQHPEYVSPDGFHPSTLGAGALAEAFYQALTAPRSA